MEGRDRTVAGEESERLRQECLFVFFILSCAVVITIFGAFNAARIATIEEQCKMSRSWVSDSLVREKTELATQATRMAEALYRVHNIRKMMEGWGRDLVSMLAEAEQLMEDLRAEQCTWNTSRREMHK